MDNIDKSNFKCFKIKLNIEEQEKEKNSSELIESGTDVNKSQ